MKRSLILFVLTVSVCAVVVSQGKQIRVPQDYAKIQSGINAAATGDTVLVAEGLYTENIRITKKIVVASLFVTDNNKSHITSTIINGSTPSHTDSGSVVTIEGDVDTTTVIMGFTITGGKGNRRHNAAENIYGMGGGGVDVFSSGGARISNNIIKNNTISNTGTVTNTWGGGIAAGNGSVVSMYTIIEYNTIFENSTGGTYGEGGGILLMTNGRVIGNNISKNASTNIGGGISVLGGTTLLLQDNYISGNSAGINGGGLIAYYYSISKQQPRITMQNNILSTNSATGGSAIRMNGGDLNIINTTITNHTGPNNVIRIGTPVGSTASIRLLNSIVWNPSTPMEIYFSGGSVAGSYNCVRGGMSGIGNIDSEPQFVPGDSLYRLHDISVCIARGIDSSNINGVWLHAPFKDFFGATRPQPIGTSPDLGAHEHVNGTLWPLSRLPIELVMKWEGYDRYCIVDFPIGREQQKGLPVVFNLHAYGWTSFITRGYMNMHGLGDSVGFITVYPSAQDLTHWNSGISNVAGYPTPNADDVGFISLIIDSLKSRYDIDLERVYSCGYSNGGMMSMKLAGQLGNRIAAVANVAGSMPISTQTNYAGKRPVPVMLIHGTADPEVLYDGGISGLSSVNQSIEFLRNWNYCTLPAETLLVPDRVPNDLSTVERYTYRSASNSSQVVLFKVIGGRHHWPGAPAIGTFPINQDIDASKEIWNFFKQFSIQNPSNGVDDEMIDIPQYFRLSQNYPNPFNPATVIDYTVAAPSEVEGQKLDRRVRLSVYDLLGREVAVLVNEQKPAGRYMARWDACRFPSGVYFYRLIAGEHIQTNKMVLTK